MSQLTIQGLGKAYAAGPDVLSDITLQVASGERFVLLGASGSGKSTLLRVIAGLEGAQRGEVRLAGQSMLGVPAERRDIGLVFQQPLLFPHLTVARNLSFGLNLRGVSAREIGPRVEEMLSQTGLSGFGQRLPHQLSGGQEQRVALARALITAPKMLLLDEPFSALDAPLRREMRRWVVDLQQKAGTTLLLVTHDQEEALAVAQRIGFLEAGRLQQVGEPEDFFLRPASLSVARFFGGQNFIAGVQSGLDVQTALGRFVTARQHHGPVTLTFRPEALQLGEAACNSFVAVICGTSFGGTFRQYDLEVCGQRLVWQAPPTVRLTVGERVALHCPAHACWTLPDPRD
ncbi:ABC transporter ATP-binding protein [Deinococcus aerolatus]|uniref:ABC transporter ATP-binding protein n=1 Tax=Deinococcus aerolatus TaxID=522487 RepID=A0ABQ2G852_9DEIO|nr:ABC transporter ATP-binding protein [Deinococcus aerolatus]GGL79769.1 ABC transporter ATP-binding protein [Deinococcus aerolatus]